MYQNKVTGSLAAIHRPGNSATTVKWSITKTFTLQYYPNLLHCQKLINQAVDFRPPTLFPCQVNRRAKSDQLFGGCKLALTFSLKANTYQSRSFAAIAGRDNSRSFADFFHSLPLECALAVLSSHVISLLFTRSEIVKTVVNSGKSYLFSLKIVRLAFKPRSIENKSWQNNANSSKWRKT